MSNIQNVGFSSQNGISLAALTSALQPDLRSGQLSGASLVTKKDETGQVATFKSNKLQNSASSNTFGVQVPIDTLTSIRQKIVEQKFYELFGYKVSDFVPTEVLPGTQAWAETIKTPVEYFSATDFASSRVLSGRGQIVNADVGVTTIDQAVGTFAMEMGYTIFEVSQWAQAGIAESMITAKEKARKKWWDLGVQQMMGLGLSNDPKFNGLLSLTSQGVVSDTTTITKPISEMNETEFNALLSNAVGAYIDNTNSTTAPNTFVIALNDLVNSVGFVNPAFPFKQKLEALDEAFKRATGNPEARVLPLAYCNSANNNLGLNRYAMYNCNEDSISMSIPIDYTVATVAQSLNGIQFQNVAFGRLTGVLAKRPQEILYFDF